MAETETKGKSDKGAAADKPRPQKGEKSQQAQKGPKLQPGEAAAKGDAAARPKARKPEERVTPRLKTHFDEVVRKKLADEFGYKNRMQVPVIEKVVINMGIGEGVNDRKKVEAAANDLSLIAGQKAVIFPRALAEKLRWWRKLHDRHQGTHHLPRDRLRQGGRCLGDGHHRVHQREIRRRGARAVERVQLPVPAVRASSTAESRRH